MDESPDRLNESRAALRRAIAARLQAGESRVAVRDSLIAGGLPEVFADGFLAGLPERQVVPASSVVGMVLSVLSLGLLPVAGLVAGVWAGWSVPPGDGTGCGIGAVLGSFLLVAGGGLLGLAAGIVLSLLATAGLVTLSSWRAR